MTSSGLSELPEGSDANQPAAVRAPKTCGEQLVGVQILRGIAELAVVFHYARRARGLRQPHGSEAAAHGKPEAV
jgi:hypothetical protein